MHFFKYFIRYVMYPIVNVNGLERHFCSFYKLEIPKIGTAITTSLLARNRPGHYENCRFTCVRNDYEFRYNKNR